MIEQITDGNQGIHKLFLEMRKSWIKEYNNDAAATASGKKMSRLSVAGQVKVKSRYVEVMKTMKTAVAGRDRDFVEKEHWDEKLDGKYDASKEVTELIHGKIRKGCWK